mmetsp:Transcript_25612/g.43627  ORF Transcript_25612/g.43627 Transcript_25612/m.43627 type:complete len:103 (-) Transcript_25612:2859-3167(-)
MPDACADEVVCSRMGRCWGGQVRAALALRYGTDVCTLGTCTLRKDKAEGSVQVHQTLWHRLQTHRNPVVLLGGWDALPSSSKRVNGAERQKLSRRMIMSPVC